MTQTSTETPVPHNRLEHFPVAFFSAVMGLMGTSLAVEAAGFATLGHWVAGFALLVFAAQSALYGLKALRYPRAVAAEWNHPIKLAFFPAISISLLLGAIALRGTEPDLAAIVWVIGASAQALLTLAIVTSWISHRGFGVGQMSPAWFIPAVGNVNAPIAGVTLGFEEASWYFFSIGLMFWIVLLTLVFNRLVFHDPLPGKLRPTLTILIAPPAVAFLAWLQLNGGVLDAPARILYNLGLFFAALVLVQLPGLLKLPFALSFWALSFPVAAMTIASFRYAALSGAMLFQVIGWTLLGLLAAIITGLVWRTAIAVGRGEICQPE
ncbi:MAG: SLAC1 anion channel family protein [Marivita sp.]|uniref:SLAC1 anion channel family protein n=1 Tax=Marivita sp. TaxID=2003365 RepID=UPI0025B89691|nr:SLAC1 anion channel family protein [Marivita sp.]MCI5111188.1 SLAC1 anion channel family protein [Marivita sp.]